MRSKNRRFEYITYLAVFIACILLLLLSGIVSSPPKKSIMLPEEWTASVEGKKLDNVQSPFYFSNGSRGFEKGLYEFGYELKLDEEIINTYRKPVIVFNGVSGNGLKVSLNGEVLGTYGDLISGNASIWNFSYAMYIPPDILSEKNHIKVELFNLYEVGLYQVPYITDAEKPLLNGISFIIWSVNYIHFLIGGMVVLGIVFIITGAAAGRRDIQKIYLGLAFFFISVFFLDYSYLNNLSFSYLIFKKIVISSHFTGLLFFIFYISEIAGFSRNRFKTVYAACLAVLILLTILYPGDMVRFREYYQIAYISNLALFMYLLYLFLKKAEHTTEMITIFAGGFTALILAAHDILCLFIPGGQRFFSHIGIAVLFLTGAAVMIYQIINIYIESMHHSVRAEQFYAESMRDPLTGVYNRKILPALENKLCDNFSVLLFDLDDFKQINDSYGHGAGDIALKAFTKSINSVIRSNDYIVRIGGDEFVAVLPGCGLETAEEQGKSICDNFRNLELAFNGIPFSVSATLGSASGEWGTPLSRVIEDADMHMYSRKKV